MGCSGVPSFSPHVQRPVLVVAYNAHPSDKSSNLILPDGKTDPVVWHGSLYVGFRLQDIKWIKTWPMFVRVVVNISVSKHTKMLAILSITLAYCL